MEMEKYEVRYYSDIIGNKTIKPQQQQQQQNIYICVCVCDVEGEGAVNERRA
jgi:hypothetical protein